MNELTDVRKPNAAFFFQGESLRIAFDAEQFSRNFYKHFHVIKDYFVLFFNKSLILNIVEI